ncbi:MAG: O-antigen ligase family protein, partial [Defluviitaleaceae bacterium]|nr:O-antigen ligase family protein [Defluviitaleaceae bacterium]
YGDMDSVRVFVISFACISFAVLLPHIIKDKKTLDMFILMIFIGITISALFGLYQFAMGIEVRADFTDLTHSAGLARLFSTMANPNNDAKVWVMLIPYCVAYLLLSKNDLKKVILAGMLGICVLALVLTYSRSGYLAIVAGMAVFVILVAPRLVPIGIILAVIAIPFLPSSVTDRVLTIGQDTSSRYRMMIWEGTFRMNRDYWISGIGMGPSAFTRIYRVYSHPSAGNAMHTHNVFLNVLAEAGVGALLAFVAYFIRILKEGVSSVYKANSVNIKFFAAAGIASLTGFFMFAMVEYVWFYPRVMLTFFISMGLVHSIYRINREASQ